MYLFIVIGQRGQGKTTWINNFIRGKRQYVFDVNNEYQNLPADFKILPAMRNKSLDIKTFLLNVQKIVSTNIVFEDATGFFRGRQSPLLMKEIIRMRHTRNNFLIIFHSINRVPPELFEMANYIVLFKTNDNLETINNKFHSAELNAAFIKQRAAPDHSYTLIKLI